MTKSRRDIPNNIQIVSILYVNLCECILCNKCLGFEFRVVLLTGLNVTHDYKFVSNYSRSNSIIF